MKNQKSDFSVLKEEIAQNNVLTMAELITIMEVRFQIGYIGSRMQKMYADLYRHAFVNCFCGKRAPKFVRMNFSQTDILSYFLQKYLNSAYLQPVMRFCNSNK